MSKFIYVFTKEAAKDMKKRGYELLKVDEKNQIWVFANKDPENISFSSGKYQCVLSDVLSF